MKNPDLRSMHRERRIGALVLNALAFLSFVIFAAPHLSAQQTVFSHVIFHHHHSAQDRMLVNKAGTLTFDDSGHTLTFNKGSHYHIGIAYDAVEKVIFDQSIHMRGTTVGEFLLSTASIPGALAAEKRAEASITDYWFYVTYKDHDAEQSVLFTIPKNSSAQVIEKAKAAFGSRVSVTDFPEKSTAMLVSDLPGPLPEVTFKIDKEHHPLPEIKADKATVVVVYVPVGTNFGAMGTPGLQVKLHANDQVIAVNKMGTYSFAYVDPGKYLLAAQRYNASGFEMQLEARHEYYLLQNAVASNSEGDIILSRNSPEVVTYLVDGSYFADWKPKKKKK